MLLLLRRDRPDPSAIRRLGLVAILIALALPAAAQSPNNPSGLPLPRFAATRSEPINVRVGPGTRYEVAWVYVKSGQPVEIVQEFDTWRKIRDVEGEEGWVHQNLLSGTRMAFVAPWADGETPLYHNADKGAVAAWLGPGYRVELKNCDGLWCAARAEYNPEEGGRKVFSGYLQQAGLWGVYPGEVFK